jgi:hypothetical protein
MNTPHGIYRTGNPFLPRPADRLDGFPQTAGVGAAAERPPVHVETDTLAKVREQVEDYFGRPARGRALALVGPYGIGKTHLTREIITLIRGQGGPPPLWMIDGAIPDLGDIYQDRLMSLRDDRNQQAVFEDLVSDYLSDVTAAELERENQVVEQRSEIVRGLRRRDYDPEKVARALRMDVELIQRDLRRHLSEITEDRKFATALALLLDRNFNRIVWDWLAGNPPQQPLIDRGIAEPIRGVNAIFETLTVFAFLYGTGGKPYVLVIDALENVLTWPALEQTRFIEAFLRLVNVYISRGGLLIFCIPPEPLRRLPPSLHERTMQFWPTGLTDEQTAELIKKHLAPHRAAVADPERGEGKRPSADHESSDLPADELAPFTSDAVAEIRELFSGNPRWILTVCSQAWDYAEEASDPAQRIDVSVVHRAVRTLFERATREHVLSVIEDALAAGQWRTETRAIPSAGRAGRVDFWVHVGANSALAIMVRDSILVGAEVDALEQDVAAARAEIAGAAEVLVVVNGLLSQRLRRRLTEVTRTYPVVYDDQDFPDRLHGALTELTRRLETADQTDFAAALRDRVGQLAGQQNEILDYLRHLSIRLERVTPGDRRRRPDEQASAAGPAARPGAVATAPGELPGPVRLLFDEAFAVLDLISDISSGLDRTLGVEESGEAPADVRPERLGFTIEQFEAIGVATTMRRLLETFEQGIASWLRAVRADPAGAGPSEGQRRRLFVMCRSFEITAEVMPLSDLAGQAAADTDADSLSVVERRDRALRRAGAEDVFNRLGSLVREAALNAAEPGRQVDDDRGAGEP